MWFFRALGWLLLFASIAVLVDDSITALQTGSFRLVAAGELWYRLDTGSLNLLQSITQRYISIWAWDNIFGAGPARPGTGGAVCAIGNSSFADAQAQTSSHLLIFS